MNCIHTLMCLLLFGSCIQPAIAFAQLAEKTGSTITTKEDKLEAIRRGASIREKLCAQYGGALRLGDLVTVQRVVDGILIVGGMDIPLSLNAFTPFNKSG